MMDELIASFTAQLTAAIEIGRKAELTPQHHDIRNVCVAGLGGSGIGANIVNSLIDEKMKVPMTVVKDYFLPASVNTHTLLICCSYSGNTEETVHAFEEGLKRDAKIVCITSGGSLKALAEKAGIDCIVIPSGMPPRACLAYSFVQQLYVLFHYRLIDLGFEVGLNYTVKLLNKHEDRIRKQAKKIAKKLNKKTPIIYSTTPLESVAVRFRQQLNENSKVLAWHHVLPEMNHNELVGWRQKGKYAVVYLRTDTDFERISSRWEINKKIIADYCKTIIEIEAKGTSFIEKVLYLVHLTDWISFELAELRKVDPVEVKVIDFLKAELSN